MTQPGIPNDLILSTACYGPRLKAIEDQAFSAVAMGFRRLELGLSENPPDLAGWEDSNRETGITVDSVIVGALNARRESLAGSHLGSLSTEHRERALNVTRRHLRLAQQLAAPIVIVRGCAVDDAALIAEGQKLSHELLAATDETRSRLREPIQAFAQKIQKKGHRQLEHFCRSLHSLRREFPETRIAVEPGFDFVDLLTFEAMQWCLDDLAGENVGYWHDTGRIHQRGLAGLPGQGAWLDGFAARMVGIHLSDATYDEAEMPPGSGEVDYKLVAEYLPRELPRVVEVAPSHGRAEVLGSIQFLVGLGL